MRIGITVNSYYPYKDGVQFVTQAMAEGLVQSGNQVTVITDTCVNAPETEMYNGVKIVRIRCKNKGMLFFGDKQNFQNTLLELSEKIELLIVVGIQRATSAWALPIIQNMKCKRILYMHGMHDYKWKKSDFIDVKSIIIKLLRNIRWYFFYKHNKKYLMKFDATIQLHNEDCGYLFMEKILPNKNFVLENFAETIFFESQVSEAVTDKYFINISGYHKRKNQRLLLKAFYMTKCKCSLMLIGNEKNKYYEQLLKDKKRYDREFGYRNVQILTHIERSIFPELLHKAIAFVSTSRSEVFPITIIEALATGTPYISTDVGLVRYIDGGQTTSFNSKAIAKKMDDYYYDTNMYQEVKNKAKATAEENYTQNKYMNKLVKIIDTVMGEKTTYVGRKD